MIVEISSDDILHDTDHVYFSLLRDNLDIILKDEIWTSDLEYIMIDWLKNDTGSLYKCSICGNTLSCTYDGGLTLVFTSDCYEIQKDPLTTSRKWISKGAEQLYSWAHDHLVRCVLSSALSLTRDPKQCIPF